MMRRVKLWVVGTLMALVGAIFERATRKLPAEVYARAEALSRGELEEDD